MKTIITILCINLFVLFFSDCSTAQNPTYNLSAKNFVLTDSLGDGNDAFTFDIFIEHTNVGASGPFEFALGQYYFNIDATSMVNSTDYNYYIIPGSTGFSNPNAIPPCGGAPYLKAFIKNPNLCCASSSDIPSALNIFA